MSRRAAIFSQADAARALRAAQQAAPGPWRLRISREGEIIVEPAPPVALSPLSSEDDPSDDLARGLEVVP